MPTKSGKRSPKVRKVGRPKSSLKAIQELWRKKKPKKENPGEFLKSGEWTLAHAVRIRKGKLEILR